MRRLGISIYPDKVDLQQTKDYIKLASSLGFSRIFTCLLSVDEDLCKVKKIYADVIYYAKSLGLETIIDVAPSVFDKFDISYDDLSFFKEIHASGIRLDEGFDGQKEAMMSLNPQGLKIEFNASQLTGYINNIISYHPNRDYMTTCHNFYPQKYTGLGLELFEKCNQEIKKNNLQIAAFVTSQSPQAFGPWPINEGLCTLEMHRNLPLELQARHLFASGVDDVIISNCFATLDEMIELSNINPGILTFKIKELVDLSLVEQSITYDFKHHVRGDMSEYMARSTFPRITYSNEDIPMKNCVDKLNRGDVVILNNNYGRYKGEIHIILKEMENEGNKNLIGRINENELFMLNYIEPWKPFKLIK